MTDWSLAQPSIITALRDPTAVLLTLGRRQLRRSSWSNCTRYFGTSSGQAMLFFTGEGNFDTNSGAIRENDWLRGQIIIIMTVPGDTRPEGAGRRTTVCWIWSLCWLMAQITKPDNICDELLCLAIKGTKYLKPSVYLRNLKFSQKWV